MKVNKKILFSIIIVVLVVIIAIVIISLLQRKKEVKEEINEEELNIEQLELEFDALFDNEENEYVISQGSVNDEKAGAYNMDVNVPKLNIDSEDAKKINANIRNIFVKKILQIGEESKVYTVIKLGFFTKVNENKLALVIKCTLKEANKPQRTIIKTYMYDLEQNKEMTIDQIIPEEKRDMVQAKINQKIDAEIKKEKKIIEQGYEVYQRNKESEIYNLQNATEFYLSQDNILYIIYCYGNNNYTNDIDFIITKI